MVKTNNMTEYLCPVCRSPENIVFLEINGVPVHSNLLWDTRNKAMDAPRSDITLAFCEKCGHIFNRTFDPEVMEYFQQYENSLHFSPCFQSYAKELADRLIESHNLHGKDIIEIGCGKGDFLKLLCKTGGNRGLGFDPSYEIVEQMQCTGSEIIFIKDFYSKKYSDHKADFVCCRHVLEHIQYPFDFLADIHKNVQKVSDAVVFFEVPNVDYTLKDLGIWDLIYEHISYFSKSSLARLFSLCGFSILNLTETYNGQFLCIEAVAEKLVPGTGYPENMIKRNDILEFAGIFWAKIESWRNKVENIQKSGQSVVVWGAGSKGVTFLNLVDTTGVIEYVIDINPRKNGKYVPGTGQKIVPPEFLKQCRPDVVLVMNNIYKDEIQQTLDSLGVSASLIDV